MKMKKRILGILLLLTPICLLAQSVDSPEKKVALVNFMINKFYVDSVDANKVAEDAIRGMLKELDPHSSYITSSEVAEMNEPLVGNFDGVGIQFNMNNDTLYILETIAGGPSERVGIRAGDRMVAINDSVIAGVKITTTDIMKRLRGKKGTSVDVKIKRQGVSELIDFRIVRDKIPIYSIDAAYMASEETGYIRISRFAAQTHEEFVAALGKLEKQGMKNLIVDLQGNGGGYLHTAVNIVDEFLDKDQMIVYTQGRKESAREEMHATKDGLFKRGRLVLLVDESSASASEILSGAVQDWDRGVLIGRRTFGKGLVQRQFPLPDKSLVRLTVARYYTPSGRSIQRPYDKGRDAYNNEVVERYNHGELSNADSIHFPDSLRYTTLTQERVVYGGGGIMPDIFVPIDTTRYTNYHRDLVAKGVLNSYAISYIDAQRDSLSAVYPTLDKFLEGYNVTSEMLQQLLAQGKKAEVKFDQEQYDRSKTVIEHQLKALIARDLFDAEAYTRVMNIYNDSFVKALEVINDEGVYEQHLSGKSKK